MKRAFAIAVILAAVGALYAAPSPPTPPADKPKPPDVSEFLHKAMTDGLTEDGVPPKFAASIAKNEDDFLGKCSICSPTQRAIAEYGNSRRRRRQKRARGSKRIS